MFPTPSFPMFPEYPASGLAHGYHSTVGSGSIDYLFDILLYILSNWNGTNSFLQLIELLAAWRLWG